MASVFYVWPSKLTTSRLKHLVRVATAGPTDLESIVGHAIKKASQLSAKDVAKVVPQATADDWVKTAIQKGEVVSVQLKE